MNKKNISILILLVTIITAACSPSPQAIQAAIAETQVVWTPIPTQTPYPTATPRPIVTRIFIYTPTNHYSSNLCKPITGMDYSDNTKVTVILQAYVANLPGVNAVHSVIPERLYNNSISQLFHVTYTDSSDGKVYSKRYIVFLKEFAFQNAVFSIDGQCWIDPPH